MTILRELDRLHATCDPLCIVSVCRSNKLNIILDIQNYIRCINCDNCGAFNVNNKRPDFIILYYHSIKKIGTWFVVEMKGRISNPRDIVKQLQNGVDIITNCDKFKISYSPKVLKAIVVRDKHVHAADFARRTVNFQGKKLDIRVIRSDFRFSTLVN